MRSRSRAAFPILVTAENGRLRRCCCSHCSASAGGLPLAAARYTPTGALTERTAETDIAASAAGADGDVCGWVLSSVRPMLPLPPCVVGVGGMSAVGLLLLQPPCVVWVRADTLVEGWGWRGV